MQPQPSSSQATDKPVKGILKRSRRRTEEERWVKVARTARVSPRSSQSWFTNFKQSLVQPFPEQRSIEPALEEISQKKSQKWDEMNIIATYKPAEKDYGLMTIDEVKTPFRHNPDDEAGSSSGPVFSVDELRSRMNSLTTSKGKLQQVKVKNLDNDRDDLHLVERESKRQFEQRRKQIYDEGRNIKRARELIAREQLDENDDSDSDHDESYHYREMDEHQPLPAPGAQVSGYLSSWFHSLIRKITKCCGLL